MVMVNSKDQNFITPRFKKTRIIDLNILIFRKHQQYIASKDSQSVKPVYIKLGSALVELLLRPKKRELNIVSKVGLICCRIVPVS